VTLVVTVVVVVVIDISPFPPNLRPSTSMTVSAIVLRDGSDLRFLGAAVTKSNGSPSPIFGQSTSAGTRRHKREGLKGYRLDSFTYTRQKKKK
jgi:hypothetical protein